MLSQVNVPLNDAHTHTHTHTHIYNFKVNIGMSWSLYIIEGEVHVSKGGNSRPSMGPGRLFGELAILYNCTRTATIKAKSNTKVKN